MKCWRWSRQRNGKVLLVGSFTAVQGGVPRNRVCRVLGEGGVPRNRVCRVLGEEGVVASGTLTNLKIAVNCVLGTFTGGFVPSCAPRRWRSKD